MPEEIEAKVKLSDPEAFRRRMAARGVAAEETVFEVNRLFDDAAGRLRAAKSALRVREERRAADGTPLRTLLTFKGPQAPGPLKRRTEHELTVEAAAPLVAIFEALGLGESFRYEKRRTAWRVGGCEVVLDELPHLGWFVEVEGPTEEAVYACLAEVGLAGEPTIRQSYVGLLADWLKEHGRDPTRAAFSEPEKQRL